MRILSGYTVALGSLGALAVGCGGGDGGGGPNPPPLVLAKAPTASGDLQTGAPSAALPNDLRVIVTRDGAPQADVDVTWSTSTGTLDPTSGQTDGTGIAASTWTLGSAAGAQSAQAAVAGANGSPVTFSATASGGAPPPPPPPNTISVTLGNIFFRSNRNTTTNPAVDTVAVNGSVTWTWVNTGSIAHSVLSTGSPSFQSSGTLTGNGESHAVQFTQAGTYTYNCAVHGSQMTGRIVVR